MISLVENFLKKYNLSDSQNTYLVGFSGGYDSTVLLDILHKISINFHFKIIALHLNHNWRGAESDLEQQNCEDFCKERSIPIIVKKLDENTPKTETCAREARLDFFKEQYRKNKASGLFLAHTKSDNAETIIQRMVRGTGVRGLCGIFENNNLNGMEVFRPLMDFSRSEIEKYCTKEKLCPNNDSSNSDTKYQRNFIRKKIIPVLKELNPEIENAFGALCKAAVSEQNIINEYLDKIKNEICNEKKFDAKKFFILSKDVKKRILLDLMIDAGIDYDAKRVNEIFNFLGENAHSKSGKTLSLAKDLWIFVSEKEIYTFSKKEKCIDEAIVPSEGTYFLDGYELNITKCHPEPDSGTKDFGDLRLPLHFPDEHSDLIYCSNLAFPMTLRFRKDGDRIQPFGMEGSMKLKKLFINKNIPKNERDSVILLCENNDVLWAHGICVSERLRANGQPDYILEIRKGGKNEDRQEN